MWAEAVGWIIFFLSLVGSIIIYAIKRKGYPIMYLISIALYIFTVCYVIEIFKLSKLGILLLLSFSAIYMCFIGWFLSRDNVVEPVLPNRTSKSK